QYITIFSGIELDYGYSCKTLPVCTYCGKIFTKTGNLNRHIRIHTGERPYECRTCGKRFSDQSYVRKHTEKFCSGRKHNATLFLGRAITSRDDGNNVFKPPKSPICSYCGKVFSVRSSLLRHIRLHTGEKPYQCVHCGKRFSDRSHRNRHSKTYCLLKKSQ
ncbi:zinc finger protein 561-like, partial [Ruditapes philippinarum]|uniref:zinc finger protein 561-like n=1 Tax=Ruditapes philippinarum TaxID=129788 RepID=UPI00295C1D8D